jgi:hypothetical protein
MSCHTLIILVVDLCHPPWDSFEVHASGLYLRGWSTSEA